MNIPTTYLSIPSELKKFDPRNLFGEPSASGLGAKSTHSENVMCIAAEIALCNNEINYELVAICAFMHDIGRYRQFDLLGCFNDREADHRKLGKEMLNEYIIKHNIDDSSLVWTIVRDVIEYHGLEKDWHLANHASLPYLKIVSAADDIENGCIGALGYLEYEFEHDVKGYKKQVDDQRFVAPELLGYLERGEKFDKMTLCHTYAEYFVFAAMLAVNSCKKFGAIAKDAMKLLVYTTREGVRLNAVDGYCHIFNRYLHPQDAEIACRIMREKCR